MKTIIIGGGKIGYNLYKTLKERGRQVTVVERDKETCLKFAEDMNADVIWGDGTDLDILKEAGIDEAEIVAAVTGSDEENLVICQIAKLSFKYMRTIARVNNPKNTVMFKNLGIDNTVCSTEVIANLIEYSLNNEEYRIVNTIGRGSMLLVELLMKENSPWSNKMIKELTIPHECVFVSILRGDEIIYPKGDTLVLCKDKILTVTNNSTLAVLVSQLYDGGNKKWLLKKTK